MISHLSYCILPLDNQCYIVYIFNMAALTLRNLPEGLRNQFKAVCAARGMSMTQEIIQHMKDVVGAEFMRMSDEQKKKGGEKGKEK